MQQRYPQHRTQWQTFVFAAIAAILFHLPLLILTQYIEPDDSQTPDASSAEPFQLTVINEKEPEEKTDRQPDEEKTQFVSAPPPEKEEIPDKADFADQVDSKTDQQTVRKAAPGAPRLATQQPESVSEKTANDTLAPSKVDPQVSTDDEESEKSAKEETAEKRDGVISEQKRDTDGKAASAESYFPKIDGSNVENEFGDHGQIDYLRDVSEGEKTLLNRKRSRYWAFFDRVKTQISRQWSPTREYRKRDPYGNIYGVKDRYSAVNVTLNADGSVRQLYMEKTSGLDFFDDEAIRSVKQAAPFYNPPEGLKDEDGLVHFTFGFYFEIQTGRFRAIRIFN